LIILSLDGTFQLLVQCHKINRTNLYEVIFVLDIHVCVLLTVYLLQAQRKWEKLCLISGSLFAIVAMVWGLHLFRYDHKYFPCCVFLSDVYHFQDIPGSTISIEILVA